MRSTCCMRSCCENAGIAWSPSMRATLIRFDCESQWGSVRFRNGENRKHVRNPVPNPSDCAAVNEAHVLERLGALAIETPSWGYGNSGTRFHVYPWPGAARDVRERIADAALVHRLTGCCPTVAVHIPWDAVDDYSELRAFAEGDGLRIGGINMNLFGEDDYRLGSLCHPDPAVRGAAVRHCLEC